MGTNTIMGCYLKCIEFSCFKINFLFFEMSEIGNDTIAKLGRSWIFTAVRNRCNGGKLVLPIVTQRKVQLV